MPSYRNLDVSLISQLGILTIREYIPPTLSETSDPFSSTPSIPPLIDPCSSTISVFVPTYPLSQFWISYSVLPPHPPNALYYFKLFINEAHVVSWGVGAAENYKGKTMFGLFDKEEGNGIERRAFCFTRQETAHTNVDGMMEVRVYRSKGRRRIQPELEVFQQSAAGQLDSEDDDDKNKGIKIVPQGNLRLKAPKRQYKYALIDPLDAPYATFRFYCRSWEQLQRMGVKSPQQTLNSSEADVSMYSTTTTSTADLFSDTSSTASAVNCEEPPPISPSPSGTPRNTSTTSLIHDDALPKRSSSPPSTPQNITANSRVDETVLEQSTTSPPRNPQNISTFSLPDLFVPFKASVSPPNILEPTNTTSVPTPTIHTPSDTHRRVHSPDSSSPLRLPSLQDLAPVRLALPPNLSPTKQTLKPIHSPPARSTSPLPRPLQSHPSSPSTRRAEFTSRVAELIRLEPPPLRLSIDSRSDENTRPSSAEPRAGSRLKSLSVLKGALDSAMRRRGRSEGGGGNDDLVDGTGNGEWRGNGDKGKERRIVAVTRDGLFGPGGV